MSRVQTLFRRISEHAFSMSSLDNAYLFFLTTSGSLIFSLNFLGLISGLNALLILMPELQYISSQSVE